MSLKIYFDFKVEPRKYRNQKCIQNGVILVTSKNTFFNVARLVKFDVAIGFVALKQVQD